MEGWSHSYADYCSSLPVVRGPSVCAEGDGADGRRELRSKRVAEELVEDVVIESEEIVGADWGSGLSSSGTYFTATDTEEVKEV